MAQPKCEPADRDMQCFGELLDLGDAGDGASGFGHLHKVVRRGRQCAQLATGKLALLPILREALGEPCVKRMQRRLTREDDAVGQQTGRNMERLGQLLNGVEVGDSGTGLQVSTGIVCHAARQRESRSSEIRALTRVGKSLGEAEMQGVLSTTNHRTRYHAASQTSIW